MKIWPNLEQRSEAWFKARAGRPTASKFSKIITAASGRLSQQAEDYMIELIADCICPGESDWGGNKFTDYGEELEPEARKCFEQVMGLNVEQPGFITRDDEVVGCSPDGLVLDAQGEYIAGLEIKCLLPKSGL